jgi:virulence-associated protein VagC
MAGTAIARLFTHGASQAVRLPKEFQLPAPSGMSSQDWTA